MSMPSSSRVLIIDSSAAWYRDALAPRFPDVEFVAASTAGNAASDIRRSEVLAAFGSSLPDGFLANAGRLRWIHALSAGTDYLLKRPDLPADLLLTSSSGIHGAQLAEMAIWAMLSLARATPTLFRQQMEAAWHRPKGSLLSGKRVMVIGTGTSGNEIRRLCSAFGMHVVAASRTPRQLSDAQACVTFSDVAAHVADVDFLVLAMASNATTRGGIGRSVLRAIKPGAYLVNLARGDVLDDAELLHALETGRLAGAALDVFRQEPLPADHPFWRHPRIIVTPHVAGHVQEYEARALPLLERNLRAYFQGQPDMLENVILAPNAHRKPSTTA